MRKGSYSEELVRNVRFHVWSQIDDQKRNRWQEDGPMLYLRFDG